MVRFGLCALLLYGVLASDLEEATWTFKASQERFLAQKEPCALVATSSVTGVAPSGGSNGMGKHGCLAVMESLHGELLAA